MPRELSNEPCEVTFDDRISGDKLTVYYRMPTTQERIKYANGYITRRGNQIISTLGELRQKAGSAVLLGFKTGAFNVPGKGLISSTPGETNYDPDWKTAVKQYAADVIEILAIHVFETSMIRSVTPKSEALEILPPVEEEWDEPAGAVPEAKAAGGSPDVGKDGGEAGGEAGASPLS